MSVYIMSKEKVNFILHDLSLLIYADCFKITLSILLCIWIMICLHLNFSLFILLEFIELTEPEDWSFSSIFDNSWYYCLTLSLFVFSFCSSTYTCSGILTVSSTSFNLLELIFFTQSYACFQISFNSLSFSAIQLFIEFNFSYSIHPF